MHGHTYIKFSCVSWPLNSAGVASLQKVLFHVAWMFSSVLDPADASRKFPNWFHHCTAVSHLV